MEGVTIQGCVDAFEKELKIKFHDKLKIVLVEYNSILTIPLITTIVAEHSGVPLDKLLSPKREKREISDARMIAMFFINKNINPRLSEIGKYFGGRHHTTVINAVRTIRHRIATKDYLTADILQKVQNHIDTYQDNENKIQN
jgi:chromosomal replication initiation ATPase DnaA